MRVLMTSIALAGLFAANPATAETTDATYRVAIQFDDLNLASDAGIAALKGRVKAQANAVCGGNKVHPLREADNIRQCRADLMRGAERRIEMASSPASATLFASR